MSTEQNKEHHEIDEQNNWFLSLLKTSKDAIIGIDSNDLIKFLNPVAEQLLGIEEKIAIGIDASRVIMFKDQNCGAVSLKEIGTTFESELYNRANKTYVNITGNIAQITNSKGELSGKIITLKDVDDLKNLFNRIKYQTSHDNLTGILNRKSFIKYADDLIDLSKKESSTHGLIVVSLDKFKIINDTCGHIAGDELLRKIAYLINDSDTKNEHIIGRISGDEFGILLKNTKISKIKNFASTLKREVGNQDFIWGEKEFPIMCSFGIVLINNSIDDHYKLFAAADDACAFSKEKGGNRIEIYNGVKDEYHKRRIDMMWIHKLKNAIENDMFLLYYQDIKAIKKGDINKIEILVRLKDEKGNILPPSEFIPSAELYGLMPKLDRIIIEKAVKFCQRLLTEKTIMHKISVNISAASILDKSLPNFIKGLFQEYKVPPTLFCFEITETTTIKNMELAKKLIKDLKNIGCSFSLDDFGTGFSNFTYLRDLDVDYLKIDGTFVVNMLDEPINKAMVESINNIGHIMKMKTVAEFVTNDKIKDALIKIGVDYLQGYSISEPTPIENLLL